MKETTDSSSSAQAKASTRIKALVRNPVDFQSKNLYLLLWGKQLPSITNVSGKPQLVGDRASDFRDSLSRSSSWQTGAERIPWTEGSWGLQSVGLQRVGQDWSNLARMQSNTTPHPQKLKEDPSAFCPEIMPSYLNRAFPIMTPSFFFFYFRKSWKSDFNENFFMTKDNCPPLS